MKLRKAPLLAAALSVPVNAFGLGLGPITLSSALNEPLDAEIALLSVSPAEIEDLRVRLAESAEFQRAGLEQPHALSKLRFRVVEDPAGEPVVKVTSTEPVREPVLSFLMEANWPNGRLLREYTVLLDPPVYGDAAAASVRGVEAEHGVVVRAGEAQGAAAPAAAPGAPPAARAPSPAPGGAYTVQRNDTLWSIAREARPEGISVQQMMLAILETNPEAFIGDNVNALKAGYVLQMPSAEEARRMGREEALAEVRRQHSAWAAQRGRYAEAPAAAAPAAPTQPQEAAQPEEPAPAAAAPEGELRLVSPGQGEQGGAGGQTEELRRELTLAEEELDTRAAENAELRSRLAETESIIEDLKSLVELKDAALATLEARLAQEDEASEPVPGMAADEPLGPEAAAPPGDGEVSPGLARLMEGEPMPEEAPAAEPEPAPAEPGEATLPPTAPTVEPPAAATEPPPAERPVPTILPPPPEAAPDAGGGLPVSTGVLAGLGAAVVALLAGGLLLVRRRRRREEEAVPETSSEDFAGAPRSEEEVQAGGAAAAAAAGAVGVAAGQAAARDEDETGPPTEEFEVDHTGATVEEESTEVLDEVNVYLAYERYDQAEGLVRQALEESPQREDYWLKLLEVHHAARAPGAFAASALAMRDALGAEHPAMEKAHSWWQELAPGEDMEAMAAAGVGEPTVTDFETDQGEIGEMERTARFDLEGDESLGERPTAEADALDFDLGLTEETEAERTAREEAELDLDLSLEDDADLAGTPESEAGIDFDLDLDESPERPTGVESDLDFKPESGTHAGEVGEVIEPESPYAEEGLDFDLGEEEPKPAGEADAEVLDFDLGEEEPRPGGEADAEALDFDLGEVGPEAEEEADRQPREPGAADVEAETALDFDLGPMEEEEQQKTTVGLEAGPEALPESPEEAGPREDLPMDIDFELESGDEVETQTVDHVEEPDEDAELRAEEGLDFELEMGDEGTEEQRLPGEAGDFEVDLDLGEAEPGEAEPGEAKPAPAAGQPGEEVLDFDLGAEPEAEPEAEKVREPVEEPEFEFDLDMEGGEEPPARTVDLGAEGGGDIDEIGTKLDLAQAYIDMGDGEGARAILDEVMSEGNESQQAEARELLDKLSQ